jgi:phosphate/sulfate permease
MTCAMSDTSKTKVEEARKRESYRDAWGEVHCKPIPTPIRIVKKCLPLWVLTMPVVVGLADILAAAITFFTK